MEIRELTQKEAEAAMKSWRTSQSLPILDGDYLKIREDFQTFYQKEVYGLGYEEYKQDVIFARYIYDYFKEYENKGLNMRALENDGFWRYLSLVVVPDIVGLRWGNDNENHYYKRSYLIWLKMLWWYIYLSWYRSAEETKDLLLTNNFNTDTLLQLVERSGKQGTYVDVYRLIVYYYQKPSGDDLSKFVKRFEVGTHTLFRVLMKLNTAKLLSVNPVLFLGGVDGYVKSLYREAGVPVD